ncbi:MAG TPA: AsmA family protein, partial [Methylomirabilota bacterium]|nr:AsmA family protein [Methylomirabilota bacterium]
MLKWTLIGLGVLLLLVVGALLALPLVLDTPAIQAYISQAASHALGRPVRFGGLSIAALPRPSVRMRGLQIAEDPSFGPGPFVTVAEGRMRIRIRPLLRGRVELADLTLEEPRIHVVEDAAGRLNVATLGGTAAPTGGPPRPAGGRGTGAAASAVLLSRVRIVNGAVDYRKAGAATAAFTLDTINVTVTQGGAGEALRIAGEAQGQPGNVKLTISEGAVTVPPGRTFGEAQLRATVDVQARDVAGAAAAFVPSPSVSGPLRGRVQVSGTP